MNDLDFVQRCIKGDSQSWDEFLKRYSRLIYKYIHSVINSKGINLDQDFVNDTFQDLFSLLIEEDYKKLRTFKAKNGCSLASWLRQVAINFTIDRLRRLKPILSLDAEPENGFSLKDTLTDGSFSVPELLMKEEKLRNLEDCVEGLTVEDKYFLELNFNQGIKLDILKDIFRISRGAIDMQKSRLIDRLKDCFKRKGFALDL